MAINRRRTPPSRGFTMNDDASGPLVTEKSSPPILGFFHTLLLNMEKE